MRRIVLGLFLLGMVPVWGQAGRRVPAMTRYVFEIRDAETGAPLAGAEVESLVMRSYGPRKLVERTGLAGTANFALMESDELTLKVRMTGYTIPLGEEGREETVYRAVAGERSRQVVLRLAREGTMEGEVRDRESGKPVEGLTVRAQLAGWERGVRRLRPAGTAGRSDASGRFRVTGLAPGPYFLEVAPQETERIGQGALAGQKEPVYTRMYWPDGDVLEAAGAVTVVGGARLTLGTVHVRRQAVWRVVGRLESETCRAGEQYKVRLYQVRLGRYEERVETTLGCRALFTVKNLVEGTWRVESEAMREQGEMGWADVVVKGEDVELKVRHQAMAAVRLRVEERGAVRPERLWVQVERMERPAEQTPEAEEYGAEAGWWLSIPGRGRMRLRVTRLEPGVYVKEVLYNGQRAERGVFEVQETPKHELVVAFGGEAPEVAGMVRVKDKGVGGALVVAGEWPVALRADWPETRVALGDGTGRYRMAGLAPGEYRVFAIEERWRARLEEPGVLLRLLGEGQRVELEAGGRVQLDLALVEP